MLIYVVRHACAGHKAEWHGADVERPLDVGGRAQADALAALLAGRPLRRLLSSPARRCVETVEPLAERTGLAIGTTPTLTVGAPAAEVTALLLDPLADHTVFCTHGEVMAPLLERLRGLGVVIEAEDTTDEALLGKGTAWAVEVHDGGMSLEHLAPLPMPGCPAHPTGRG